jgi:hypothetical protein
MNTNITIKLKKTTRFVSETDQVRIQTTVGDSRGRQAEGWQLLGRRVGKDCVHSFLDPTLAVSEII